MQNLTQPTLLLKPFAENGQRNTIPENATGTNLASLDEGFPPVTGQNPRDGGIPPTRLDFNGLGHLTTTYDYFYQAGGCFTFNQVVSDAIGGYPLNARLWYMDSNGESSVLRSTKANNTDNFLTDPSVIGDSWVYDVATTTYVKDEINEIRTNCITEIPQDIKLELNNGTLTLKAGSKVYVPNGAGKFDVITTTSDTTRTSFSSTTSYKYLLVLQNNTNLRYFNLNQISSGATAPTGANYLLWYDTTNNLVKISSDGGSTWVSGLSLPLCLFSADTTTITSIDQVFNGFGYIGSTVFALPGVKGLFPNGRNADGTLKNIEKTTTQVKIGNEAPYSSSLALFDGTELFSYGVPNYFEQDTLPTGFGTHAIWFNTRENKIYQTTDGGSSWVIVYKLCLGKLIKQPNENITELSLKNTFHAVDYNDMPTITLWE